MPYTQRAFLIGFHPWKWATKRLCEPLNHLLHLSILHAHVECTTSTCVNLNQQLLTVPSHNLFFFDDGPLSSCPLSRVHSSVVCLQCCQLVMESFVALSSDLGNKCKAWRFYGLIYHRMTIILQLKRPSRWHLKSKTTEGELSNCHPMMDEEGAEISSRYHSSPP